MPRIIRSDFDGTLSAFRRIEDRVGFRPYPINLQAGDVVPDDVEIHPSFLEGGGTLEETPASTPTGTDPGPVAPHVALPTDFDPAGQTVEAVEAFLQGVLDSAGAVIDGVIERERQGENRPEIVAGPYAPEVETWDPKGHTVAEVNAYLDEHPQDAAAVLALEAAGDNRRGIVEGPHRPAAD